MKIDESCWSELGGMMLDPKAMAVVKSSDNTIVTAGPGAGKTELLAQRVFFLLQTGSSPHPKKILALSLKRDSASNLSKRVAKYLSNQYSSRFISGTFDAFTKKLVDNYRMALPESQRPNKDYTICLKDKDVDGKLVVNFKYLAQLASYLLQQNPLIKTIIQNTYSHVLLDEFQDTTTLQYSFLKECFQHQKTVFTAVGDPNQAIMSFAGATPEIFPLFTNEFHATQHQLAINYRSDPSIVELLNNLLQLDSKTNTRLNVEKVQPLGNVIVRIFDNEQQEAQILTNEISKLCSQGVKFADICILAKQKASDYTSDLVKALRKAGISAREEMQYQRFLEYDSFFFLILVLLKCCNSCTQSQNIKLNHFLAHIERENNESFFNEKRREIRKIELQNRKVKEFSNVLSSVNSTVSFNSFIDDVVESYQLMCTPEIMPTYQIHEFGRLLSDFKGVLWNHYLVFKDWKTAFKYFLGEFSIPIMTIHKSKGLEFEYVFLVGVEDSAFWSLTHEDTDDYRAFYVALSRAKKHISISYAKQRKRVQQTCKLTSPLYQKLQQSGTVQFDYFTK